jgi:hypothetical protein
VRPSVCMCVWKRIENIPIIIKALEHQTYSDFDFNIWDNSGELEVLNTFLDVNIYSNNKNDGSKARFWLVLKTEGNPIIFFDDDQIPRPDFVEYMVECYRKNPNAVQSRKSRIFDELYWGNSTNNKPYVQVDYCGTGGMVLDRKLFEDERLMNIPEPFDKVEDLYLSYIARTFHNMLLLSIESKVKQLKDGKNQLKIFKLGGTKQKCFNILRKSGWKLLKDK